MKTVLVTGSAKGIGRSIIEEFSDGNYNVVINYKTSSELANKLLADLKEKGIKALAIKADISNETEVDNMFNIIEKEFGGVDILVNNAAIDLPNLFQKQSIEDFKNTFDVNVIGAYIVSKRAYKHMIENKWGRIINISSTNGINNYYPVGMAYDASKAALISLTHNFSIQCSPFVTVNAVAPGFISTESEMDGYDEEFLEEEKKKILLGRVGKPSEVASVVYFLASDKASYINNSVIRVDGGDYHA